ncbi:flagellar protein FlgN [Petroclostridium sp. X23]|uniref:flagellar protein FlgN n=1 Tax=Petroclostridium sp. X23 TaxID=3045146 RepID=UPI0024ACF872|nr:flagellar protein FlgN [Petroclostridium sp. X23]WHH61521.1 flagellar protein FlgN [Petroclostridium sp. X23]
MEDMIKELFDILEQQERVYGKILKLSKDKTELVVSGKVTELENVVKLEQALVMQVGRLEQLRGTIAEHLAEKLNLGKQDITISTLMGYMDEVQQKKLKSFEQRMLEILEELKDTNQLNAKLIKQSLEYIEFSMNVIAGTSAAGNNYEGKGTARETKGGKNLFDIKL